MTGLEKVCFWLMAALPLLQLMCILTDREQPTSKRYWWYLPPSILSLLTAIAVGLPRIIDKRIGGFGCWCTGIRKCSGTWLFARIRYSIWNRICKKQLYRKNLY